MDDHYKTVDRSESNLKQFQSDVVATEKKSLASKVKGTLISVISTITGIL